MLELTLEQQVRATYDQTGSIRATSRLTGLSRHKVKQIIDDLGPIYAGQVLERPTYKRPIPKSGKRRYYILTCAQNSSKIHPVLDSIEQYADHLRAKKGTEAVEIMVSRFAYSKQNFQRGLEKPTATDLYSGMIWDDRVHEYISDDRVELAPSLVWCGEMNILPTATNPLSGFETYTGRSSSIIPHVKMQLASVAQMRHQGAKLNYTTGTVTQRNYLQRKAGLKAEFHHVYGAVIVEVDEDGSWFVRQLSADHDGNFYDLDVYVTPKGVHYNSEVEAINWPDLHLAAIDQQWIDLFWGKSGVLQTLRPKYQFFHDSLDFRARNHHDRKDPHLNFSKHCEGSEYVETEVVNLAHFFQHIAGRQDVHSVVVESNHDTALMRWLKEADYRDDPANALFFLKAQLIVYTMLADNNVDNVLGRILREYEPLESFTFLNEDDSFVICPEHGGIECGMHGHLGPNGSRGGVQNLSKIGRRANIGHMHSAAIRDGLYVAGTCAMNPKYAKGPSSWSVSFIVTYPNGKRAIVTCWEGKWRA